MSPAISSWFHAARGSLARGREAAKRLSGLGLDLLYPPHCAFCMGELSLAADEIALCEACHERLAHPLGPVCRRCGATVPEFHALADCPRCRDPRRHFAGTVLLGRYQTELHDAVLRTKRAGGAPLAMALGRLLALRRTAELAATPCDLVAPVPMHWTRCVVRGINGPELLAESLADALKVRLARDLLFFRRRTLTQASLSPRMRFANVRWALGVSRSWSIAGARILIVDDVMTTGATCSEAAKVLTKRGAAAVYIAVVARAEGSM
ncbi:MAG: double zinc ribbon domain-containing protein [Pirellulales bacterium]